MSEKSSTFAAKMSKLLNESINDKMVNDKMVNGVMFKITPPHMAKCCISSFAVYIHALSYSVYVLPSFR